MVVNGCEIMADVTPVVNSLSVMVVVSRAAREETLLVARSLVLSVCLSRVRKERRKKREKMKEERKRKKEGKIKKTSEYRRDEFLGKAEEVGMTGMRGSQNGFLVFRSVLVFGPSGRWRQTTS